MNARWLRLSGMVALVVTLYFVTPTGTGDRGWAVRAVGGVIVLGALVLGMALQLQRHVNGTARRIDGLVLAIVGSIAVFAFAFYSLEHRDPGQLAGLRTRVDALYFTASTLTTVGFGDIHATGQKARVLIIVQLTFNVVFVAAAASLLSAQVRSAVRQRRHPGGSDVPDEVEDEGPSGHT